MERRALTLSLGLSLFAMYLVYSYVNTKEQELEKQFGRANFFPMVVARRDILQFQTIRPTDIDVINAPEAVKPPGLLKNPADVINSVAAVPMIKGEFILDNKIISKNIYSGLDTQISQNRRAISVPVNPKSSVGYHIEPGNRVDLAAHFEYKAKGINISEVKVFMQDLLVLASGRTIQSSAPPGVDQNFMKRILGKFGGGEQDLKEYREALNFAKKDQDYQTVTLEVTPEQAQRIVYVMTIFSDSLVLLLRNANDRRLSRIPTMNLEKIMGEDSYLVRSRRLPPPKLVPRPKFFDYVGDRPVPVY